ncbi:MAG: alpha/beta hydrolase [Oscillospiraceae bacterium]|nr:alpha/beta hydrolase [Oscillospiraceae bacterium]
MKAFDINLMPDYKAFGIEEEGLTPVLHCMIHDAIPDRTYPNVLVVPGGCYSFCSDREGEPVASRFYSFGYNAYYLEYSVWRKPYPVDMTELCAAVAYIRSHSRELNATRDVTVCGFSAGGHMVAAYGLYHEDFAAMGDVAPDRLILSYPVITMGELTHGETRDNVAPTIELQEKLSVEKHVTGKYAPTFLWACADDATVPVENSLMMAKALSAAKVSFELHIFPEGGHGLALADITTQKDGDPKYLCPHAANWLPLALEWLDGMRK